MRLTIELKNLKELEKVIQLLQSLQLDEITVLPTKPSNTSPTITLGDKALDPKALFGIWQEAPRSLKEIRSKSWNRNWKI